MCISFELKKWFSKTVFTHTSKWFNKAEKKLQKENTTVFKGYLRLNNKKSLLNQRSVLIVV